MPSIHRTQRHRAYTSAAGYDRLDDVMTSCARLYNAALEEWRTAYRQAGVSLTMYDQMKELTGIRQDDPGGWGALSLQVGRGVLRRLDRARQAFFRRVKAGEKPGYPRFKSSRRWHTIELAEVTKAMVKKRGDRYIIRVKGLPVIRLRKGVELGPAESLKGLSITRRGRRLFVNLTYAEERQPLRSSDTAVGIDMGVSDRLALSTGERMGRRHKPNGKLRRAQQRLSRCVKGSGRWRRRRAILFNQQHRERVRNRNACHEITTELVRRFGLIAMEDLNIKNMSASAKGTLECPGRNVAQKSGLNRSILEQSWGMIRTQLTYKAAWAGSELVVVDPAYTSQTCSGCGNVDRDARAGKRYSCALCGLDMDADVNASSNILRKALAAGNIAAAALDAA